jgi:hypothetical protein
MAMFLYWLGGKVVRPVYGRGGFFSTVLLFCRRKVTVWLISGKGKQEISQSNQCFMQEIRRVRPILQAHKSATDGVEKRNPGTRGLLNSRLKGWIGPPACRLRKIARQSRLSWLCVSGKQS